MAEYMVEFEFRRPQDSARDYAGGMTLADIEAIKAEAARVKEKRARKNGTSPA